ncbi:hypothetical protein THRCLA_20924 [Thraustotheca clavata]|uniref:Serine-threonine/tyrosine-protein kinase catalytic domain-containing protein n=1 Tax=Thraustotheca clavata TaxID=74557 RepID=A0A1W0A1X9_9STRA|nr:hypothetical protein THRCLA_20924 [Thraustotheca clavata]
MVSQIFLTSITNRDWKYLCVNFLLPFTRALGENPITSFAHVQLLSKLEYFLQYHIKSSLKLSSGCQNCPLNKITVYVSTYNKLNAIQPKNTNISTDINSCTAIGGEVKPIFHGQPTLKNTACVLVATSNTTVPPTRNIFPFINRVEITTPSSSCMNKLYIFFYYYLFSYRPYYCCCAGYTIAMYIFIRRKDKQRQQNEQKAQNLIKEKKSAIHGEKIANDRNSSIRTETEPTQNTGAEHGRRMSFHIDVKNSVELDVSLLRNHRLKLSNLVVLGNKPLASGAFGEVWRGTYGGQQVAIKA